MKHSEAAAILTAAAAFDNRKPDRETSQAWAGMLAGLDPHDCIEAVGNHYGRTTDWLMPAHIKREVGRIRQDRIDRAGALSPPEWLDAIGDADEFDRAYRSWLGEARGRIANGEPAELVAPPREVRQLGQAISPQAREALNAMRNAEDRAQRERGQETA